jgi:hypothetical protein
VSFFFPQTVTIEYSRNLPVDNSNSTSEHNLENHKKEPFYLEAISDIRNDFILKKKSFLEVNFSAMKVKLYQDGRPIREAQILARGDPQGWGGSHRNIQNFIWQ